MNHSIIPATRSIFMCFFLFSFLINAQVSPPRRPYREVLIKPDHADWIYRIGESAFINIQVYEGGLGVDSIEVNYTIGDDQMGIETQGRCYLMDGKATIDCGTRQTPGFRNCEVLFIYGGKRYLENVKFGFSPEKIKSTTDMPADFDRFWKKQLKLAAKVPMDAQITPLPDQSDEKTEVSLVRLQCAREGRYIYGYLCKPRKEGKFPVLMVPPGAGTKRIGYDRIYSENDFITFSIDIHGLNPLASDSVVKQFINDCKDYECRGLDKPENAYYRDVYVACVRAIDFLCSLPEWDGENVGVTGGSQGGALSIVTAVLDPRVDFLAAYYPALCDIAGYIHGQVGGWPRLTEKKLEQIPFDRDVVLQTIRYFDVVNFARSIQVPGFYSYGHNDNTCPPASVCAALNEITAPKKVAVVPITGHWRFHETNLESIEWMKNQLIPHK